MRNYCLYLECKGHTCFGRVFTSRTPQKMEVDLIPMRNRSGGVPFWIRRCWFKAPSLLRRSVPYSFFCKIMAITQYPLFTPFKPVALGCRISWLDGGEEKRGTVCSIGPEGMMTIWSITYELVNLRWEDGLGACH